MEINSQWPFNATLVLAVFYLCYKVAKKQGFDKYDSLFWALAFCFGTMFLGVALIPSSWHFAQTFNVFLLFLIIAEYFYKKRLWVIGTLLGLVALTRAQPAIGIIFFVLEIFTDKDKTFSSKLKNLSELLMPFGVFLLFWGYYNYARFGDFLEQGVTSLDIVRFFPPLAKAREYGLFSFRHIPGNLYYAFLRSPEPIFADNVSHVLKFPYIRPDPWGMSIFITSPYFIYLIPFIKLRDRLSKIILLTIILITIPIFLWFGIGVVQFGYRYALDFMPFLFWLFIRNYYQTSSKLSNRLKLFILFSVIFNAYLFLGRIW